MPVPALSPRQVAVHHPGSTIFLSLFGIGMTALWFAVAEPLYMGFHDVFSAAAHEGMSAEDSWNQFWLYALFGKPGLALIAGLIGGTILWLGALRVRRNRSDEWIERALRPSWFSIPSRATLIDSGLCVAFLLGLFGMCAILGWSVKVLAAALFIPAAITYPESRRLYRALVERVTSSLPDEERVSFEKRRRGAVRMISAGLLVMGGVSGAAGVHIWPTIQEIRWMASSFRGTISSLAEDDSVVRSANSYLKFRPNAVLPRLTLASYYSPRRDSSIEEIETFRTHSLWLVEHSPVASAKVSWRFASGDAPEDPFYREVRSVWLAHLAERPNDVRLLRAAMEFFEERDPRQAIEILDSARGLVSKNKRLRSEFAMTRAAIEARLLKER